MLIPGQFVISPFSMTFSLRAFLSGNTWRATNVSQAGMSKTENLNVDDKGT